MKVTKDGPYGCQFAPTVDGVELTGLPDLPWTMMLEGKFGLAMKVGRNNRQCDFIDAIGVGGGARLNMEHD